MIAKIAKFHIKVEKLEIVSLGGARKHILKNRKTAPERNHMINFFFQIFVSQRLRIMWVNYVTKFVESYAWAIKIHISPALYPTK